jgi:ubiquinone/menaquinone biosynthesis C-methylase UbiE
MVIKSTSGMSELSRLSDYAFGGSEAEHERLIRQSIYIASLTERFFREAGIGPGHRVLDLGSGVGDVAMLAAQLVGPSGEVVGIERDPRTIARARARVLDSGLANVTFTQSDLSEINAARPFDAVVGRYILMYLPDPGAIVRALSQFVRPGGVVAFLEASWMPVMSLLTNRPSGQHVPPWSSSSSAALT